jgi:hydrogenase maturation protease
MKVLVAGIGNIFLGDDGFGVEVVSRMSGRARPEGVSVADYGIRGVHLAYELLDGYDALILIDAMPMGQVPGTVAIIEPDLDLLIGGDGTGPGPAMDAHSMSPAVVLATLASLGGEVGRVLVVGCEPSVIEEGIGLSAPVSAAVDSAVEAVYEALTELGVPSEERSRA